MKCAEEGCQDDRVGKSKFCFVHRREHYLVWRERADIQRAEKEADYLQYEMIWSQASAKAQRLAELHTPAPMAVVQHVNMLDDSSPITKAWKVNEGVCGYASVNIHPGNCRFANWLKKRNLASKNSYSGGVLIWIHQFGQSLERKQVYARILSLELSKAHILKDVRISYTSMLD